MGIDVYARWKNISKQDQASQYTGFSVTSGDRGYLREAYHGGPYVTKFLVAEAFANNLKGKDAEHGPRIPAKVMRERLPLAVLLAMYRQFVVYKDKPDPTNITFENLAQRLDGIFSSQIMDRSHEMLVGKFKEEQIRTVEQLILRGGLPDYAQSFLDFVEICEAKERETGEACRIYASY